MSVSNKLYRKINLTKLAWNTSTFLKKKQTDFLSFMSIILTHVPYLSDRFFYFGDIFLSLLNFTYIWCSKNISSPWHSAILIFLFGLALNSVVLSRFFDRSQVRLPIRRSRSPSKGQNFSKSQQHRFKFSIKI